MLFLALSLSLNSTASTTFLFLMSPALYMLSVMDLHQGVELKASPKWLRSQQFLVLIMLWFFLL